VASTPLTFGVRHDFRQPLPHRQDYASYYAECIEEVRLAESLGFDAVWVTEHHFVDDGYLPSSFGMLAALARETRRLALGTSVVLLPLYHPLRVAEDATLVDLVSGGRLILGLGLGYVLPEFQALGVDRSRRGQLMDEGIAIIKQAWERGRVDFEGRHWRFHDLIFSPRPVQQPRPPIYLGGSTPRALARAAREADGYFHPGGATVADEVAVDYQRLADALRAAGRSPRGFPFVLGPACHLADDPERAWQEAAPAIAYQRTKYRQWGTDPHLPRPEPFTPESLARADYLVGSPEDVLQGLQRLYDRVPYTQVSLWGRLPGLSHAQACRSLELFAQRVIPPLKRYVESTAPRGD